jgi:O-antigen/teichoic acid export membrane protein
VTSWRNIYVDLLEYLADSNEIFMGLKKNLSLMGVSTIARLSAGLFTFSVLARLLGPESFGILMLWVSVSTLLSLVTNYGLTPYVLREIGVDSKSAESIINEGLTGKLILSTVILGCAIIAAWSFEIGLKLVFLCLLIASIADTFSEFLNAGFRARDRFDVEARVSLITSLSHAAILTCTVLVFPTVEAVSLAYIVSRFSVLAITIQAVTRYFAAPQLTNIELAIKRLRKSISYAIDFLFQSLFGQVDSIVLNHFIGPVAVGLYQAGMRVFQGGSAVGQIMANVFLPRASTKVNDAREFCQESRRVQMAFISFGAFFGITLTIFSEFIVQVLFGPDYSSLALFFPLLGLLFFVRFAAAAWGVVLTAAGEQHFRTIATVTHWIFIAGIASILVPSMGISGWLISLIIGNVLLGFLYAIRGARRVDSPWTSVGFTALGGIAFIPFIHAPLQVL